MSTQKILLMTSLCAVCILLLYLLSPILFPFITGIVLAYLSNSFLLKIQAFKIHRTFSVLVMFIVFFILSIILALIVTPVFVKQIKLLIHQLPEGLLWFQTQLNTILMSFGISDHLLNLQDLSKKLTLDWADNVDLFKFLKESLKSSSYTLIHWMINLILTPVVAFYLMRDWDDIIQRLKALFPEKIMLKITQVATECDIVLSGFIKGQLSVMMVVAILYSLGLSIVGLQFALLIGVTAGLLSIIPYLGFFAGLVLALLAGSAQFVEWSSFISILIVFFIGHLIEGMILAPLLIGDRIGLHPVVVIFAILAGGQLLGITGVLLALPLAAILKVLLTHLHKDYQNSRLYNLTLS
ncbi:MAG: AI-2E family transporter [Endozoicomonadaceae bacterium]|nr:AI-2E family transporter [Endozoicomonadaceae bacterium]